MEPSTLAPFKAKPKKWWVLITLIAGAVGALSAIAAGGKGTYDIAPFTVELRAKPAALGKTELAVKQLGALIPGHAEAGTHKAPIVFRATITGLSPVAAPTDFKAVDTPDGFVSFLAEDGKKAATSFAIKLALLALSGGAAAGVAISFGRWRRIVGAALAGLLTFAVIGLMVQRTYNKAEFLKTRYVLDARDEAPSILPSL